MFSYTTVQKKKKGKKRKDVGRQDLAVQLDDVRRRIVASDWFRQSVELIDDGSIHPDEALCLGLGSPSSSTVARTQLAFLVELCAHMDIHPESVSLYDPVFTEEDKQLFQDHLKFNVLPDSSNCASEIPFLPLVFFVIMMFRMAHMNLRDSLCVSCPIAICSFMKLCWVVTTGVGYMIVSFSWVTICNLTLKGK